MKTNYIFFLAISILTISSCKKKDLSTVNCFSSTVSDDVYSYTGCGNGMYISLSNHQLISVEMDEAALALSTFCKTYDISNFQNQIEVIYYTYNPSPDSIYFNYCSDIAYVEPEGTKIKWKAVSGTITASVSKPKNQRQFCESFLKSIELSNIRFVKENSTEDTVVQKLLLVNKGVVTCIP